MHELSVALALVEEVRAVLLKESAQELRAVTVAVGVLSGVDADALSFCFSLAIEGTPLQGACLYTKEVALLLRCQECGAESQPEEVYWIRCQRCGSGSVEILGGHELILHSLEVG
ncbi:MAG: hydrogenase maturation nickel metallochaperone HypA [Magnetococcales bacterium]|nr:hydrogenase maturation nickel metallochaperone HypA [Magnetococcales bacterium]